MVSQEFFDSLRRARGLRSKEAEEELQLRQASQQEQANQRHEAWRKAAFQPTNWELFCLNGHRNVVWGHLPEDAISGQFCSNPRCGVSLELLKFRAGSLDSARRIRKAKPLSDIMAAIREKREVKENLRAASAANEVEESGPEGI